MTTYKNPWFKRGFHYGPETFGTDKKPTNYQGCDVYHRENGVYDAVKNGVCFSQKGSLENAKADIDLINGPRPAEDTAQRFWYDEMHRILRTFAET